MWLFAFYVAKIVHFVSFAGLLGTQIAQLVLFACVYRGSSSQQSNALESIVRLERHVMPISGGLLLLSGIVLVAGFGFASLNQLWIIMLLVIWALGFAIANFIGWRALQRAMLVQNEVMVESRLTKAMSRWVVAAFSGVGLLIIAIVIATLRP